MTSPTNQSNSRTVTVIRWLARIFTVLILVFWGFFIVAHLVGGDGRASRPLSTNDYILLGSTLVSLVGLAVAWKWEFVGGSMTLVAFLVGAAANWNLFASPFVQIPIIAVLYSLCWWMVRGRKDGDGVTEPGV